MRPGPTGTPIYFEGQTFPTLVALNRAYPAYGSSRCVELIRNGDDTIAKIEVTMARARARNRAASREFGRKNPFVITPKGQR